MKNFKSIILIITVLLSFSFTHNEPAFKKTKVVKSSVKEKINMNDYVMITVIFQSGTTESQIQSYRNSFSRSFNIVSFKSCPGVLPTETWLISASSYSTIDPIPTGTFDGRDKDDDELSIIPDLGNSSPSFVITTIVDLNVSINDFNNATCVGSGL